MNPYINPAMQSQDISGLNSVYQNMAAQQQFENQAAMQGQQLAQQAGQTAQQSNPMALAQALRKSTPTDPNVQQSGNGTLGARVDMALNSQASPYLQNQVNQLGSNTWNPMSDYNTGANGWGSYGE
jgi:hypothetical protein